MHKFFQLMRAAGTRSIFAIIKTRLIVSVIILILAYPVRAFEHPVPIAKMLLGYMSSMIALTLFAAIGIEGKGKRYRALRDLIDLVAISILVYETGGLSSPWYVLNIFPLMSASRYLGPAWSLTVAIFASVAYADATGAFVRGIGQGIYLFGFRTLMFGAVALTASNLARARDRQESQLLLAYEVIDREILADANFVKVMNLVLNTAMEITNSDLSALVLLDSDFAQRTFRAWNTDKKKEAAQLEESSLEAARIVEQRCQDVLNSKKVLALPTGHIFVASLALGSKTRSSNWRVRLVPLEIDNKKIGVLGVFSRDRLHYYSKNDVRNLSSLASLIAIAQKNAKLYAELRSRDKESKERLQMLGEMSEQLKGEQGLEIVLPQIVKLVSGRLHSEEAALFIGEDGGAHLVKVALAGPDPDTSAKLMAIERSYGKERSIVRQVFESGNPFLENRSAPDEEHIQRYSQVLPSGRIAHYMGAPLVIGGEMLGVIRVLNRKADSYSPSEKPELNPNGFSAEDRQLLVTIAGKVAAAIRAAKFVERNRYFEYLVDNAPDPIIVLDKAGRIQKFNRECERLWGLSESEVLGKPVEQYYESTAVARKIGEILWKAEKHTIKDYRAHVKDAQGKLIPIRLSAKLFVDREQRRVGSIGVFKDEWEMLRLEEERRRAEKLAVVGWMANTVGHDIKSDIASVLNWIDTLEHGGLSPDMREACTAIREACNESVEKLRKLLRVAGQKAPNKKPISLKSFLSSFKASVEGRVSTMGVKFDVAYPESDPLILVDPDHMRQICSNLLENSLYAITLAGDKNARFAGHIDLKIEVQKDSVLLYWRDNGSGMSAEEKARAFTPFFTTKETGSGFGLFIVKTIVDSHEGRISIEWTGESGVCFKIVLPVFRETSTERSSWESNRTVEEKST